MEDLSLVEIHHRFSNIDDYLEHAVDRDFLGERLRLLRVYDVVQAAVLHELGDDHVVGVADTDAHEENDVPVLQPAQDLDFFQETVGVELVVSLLEDLDGHLVLHVGAEVDHSEGALGHLLDVLEVFLVDNEVRYDLAGGGVSLSLSLARPLLLAGAARAGRSR